MVDISAGSLHTCAVLGSGAVWCWGINEHGQLGDGTHLDRSTPVRVNGIAEAVEVAAGSRHTCARLASGRVFCWGRNDAGQLGSASVRESPVPVEVRHLMHPEALAAGVGSTCAILWGGEVWCWGRSPLDPASEVDPTPSPARGLRATTHIAGGYGHYCAVADGAVYCWGGNALGELGDGTMRDRRHPVAVEGIRTAVRIAVGLFSSCALLRDSRVMCWGRNITEDRGDGFFASSPVPVQVEGLD